MATAIFGPAGNSESFAAMGYKKTEQVADYINKMGLSAYEYQCGRGVRINETSVMKLAADAKEKGIAISLHAPYYISLSSLEEEKRRNSVNYILDSAKAVNLLGGSKIIVHTGSCSKISREAALELAKESMGWAIAALDEAGLSHIRICPETMGKINQLGTLEEVLELCKLDERMLPCIDWGHLNARTFGEMNSTPEFEKALNLIENEIGASRLAEFHSHFSKIEYTTNGGEKKHLTFADTTYGPNFEPLMELVAKKNLAPTFICESAGTQAEDALAMQGYYRSLL